MHTFLLMLSVIPSILLILGGFSLWKGTIPAKEMGIMPYNDQVIHNFIQYNRKMKILRIQGYVFLGLVLIFQIGMVIAQIKFQTF
jgi:hypothetical protein